jgi:hypothetical protein
VNEKNMIRILNVSQGSSRKVIMREAAYLLAHFVRFIPRTRPNPKLMPFVYMHMEQFEMVFKWMSETNSDLVTNVTDEQHQKNLRDHSQVLGLKTMRSL